MHSVTKRLSFIQEIALGMRSYVNFSSKLITDDIARKISSIGNDCLRKESLHYLTINSSKRTKSVLRWIDLSSSLFISRQWHWRWWDKLVRYLLLLFFFFYKDRSSRRRWTFVAKEKKISFENIFSISRVYVSSSVDVCCQRLKWTANKTVRSILANGNVICFLGTDILPSSSCIIAWWCR